MKKKIVLAVLAMCLSLTAAACGTTKDKEGTETKTEETAKEDSSEKEAAGSTGRIVTVDDLDKYITLGEYKGIELDRTVNEVTDDDVDAQIQSNLTEAAEEVSDATVENGDLVTINYVGTKDGEAFDGGTANNYDLTVGEGRMIEGFEDGIIGMKKGETKELNLTFPDDYMEDSLAGQDVVFQITLQKIRRKAELTDEWVKKNAESATTVDEYKEEVRTQLEESAEASAESELQYTAWSTVVENSEVTEYPQEDIDNAIAEFKKQITVYAEQAEMELEAFVESQGITMDDFEAQCEQYAQSKVKQDMVIQAIMDKEGMSFDDEESLKIQETLITNSGVDDLAALVDAYGQTAVDESIGLLRVEAFIVENAKINQKVTTGDGTAENADAVNTSGEEQTSEGEDAALEEELGDAAAEDETVDAGENN